MVLSWFRSVFRQENRFTAFEDGLTVSHLVLFDISQMLWKCYCNFFTGIYRVGFFDQIYTQFLFWSFCIFFYTLLVQNCQLLKLGWIVWNALRLGENHWSVTVHLHHYFRFRCHYSNFQRVFVAQDVIL